MIAVLNRLQDLLDLSKRIDFVAPLALRAYLVPVFWVAGTNKMAHFENTAGWFASLGMPFPGLMASLAIFAEVGGAVALALGFATRWFCIPMMFTMIIAAVTVHWKHGWQAIMDPMSPFAPTYIAEAMDRLTKGREILREHGHYDWLTEYGNFVMLNNGIEWAATYFLMLLALFYLGAGRIVSVDYWLHRRFRMQPG